MINYLSLFSGIGAFEKAMINQDIPFNLVGYSEIDKYASKSYSAIYGVDESMNLGDITKIDEKALPPVDFITYGFPCQDISLAGKQKGLLQCEDCGTRHEIPENYIKRLKAGEKFFCKKCGAELKTTRSGLFFEALRIIEATQPKVAIAENVKNLCSKKFAEQFKIVLDSLEEAGYNNYWKILNSKDFGIPQNRERVFIVSIRKDCDTGVFEFPEPYELNLRLKDMLEDEVDEKFYLSEKMFNYAFNIEKEAKGIGFSDSVDGSYINPEIAQTIGCRSAAHQRSGTTNYVSDSINESLKVADMKKLLVRTDTNRIMKIGHINSSQDGVVVDSDGIAPTHTAGHGNTPKILVRTNNKKGYDVAEASDHINIERPGSTTRRGRVGHGVSQTLDTKENHCVVTSAAMRGRYNESGQVEQNIEVSNREVANAITTVQKDSMVHSNLRIRKLTPLECFRLMGFDDEDFLAAKVGNREAAKQVLEKYPKHQGKRIMTEAERISKMSNTQLYKQAGNSIVVDVAEEILCMMFDEDGDFFI